MKEKMTPRSRFEERVALLALMFVLLALLTPGSVIEVLKNIISVPVMPPSESTFPADKVVHCLMFAACGFLSARAWYGRLNLVLLMMALLVFAALTEILQTVVPGRSGDIADFLADAVGIFIGAWWFRCLRIRP